MIMGIKRPLVNPLPIENTGEDDTDKVYRASREQMQLPIGIKQTKFQAFVANLKYRFRKRMEYIEVEQVWRSPAIPFMIVSTIFNFAIWFFGGLFLFNQLPQEIQFTFDSVVQTWVREDKFIVAILSPIIYFAVFLIQFRFVNTIFKRDRRLALSIAWISTVLNFLLLIALGQIYSLIFSK